MICDVVMFRERERMNAWITLLIRLDHVRRLRIKKMGNKDFSLPSNLPFKVSKTPFWPLLILLVIDFTNELDSAGNLKLACECGVSDDPKTRKIKRFVIAFQGGRHPRRDIAKLEDGCFKPDAGKVEVNITIREVMKTFWKKSFTLSN